MSYVGVGHGEYIQETTYKYVGCGGDFSNIRPRRDFTCLICVPLSLLLLIPLLLWLLSGSSTSLPFNCQQGLLTGSWTLQQKAICCATEGVGCPTTSVEIVTNPPTPLPTPPPTPLPTPPTTQPPTRPPVIGDPFNCAIDVVSMWGAEKLAWCCRVHHIGCPTVAPPVIIPVTPCMTPPPAPADPYNCADGFSNWVAGWSVGKKTWCCKVHSKGCPQVGGCVTTSLPYDCNAGYANWMAGWSVSKKSWCCQNGGKGCPPAVGGC